MSAPQGQKIDPAELEPTAGARNWIKATMKIRRNLSPGFIRLDPEIPNTFENSREIKRLRWILFRWDCPINIIFEKMVYKSYKIIILVG